MAAVLIFRAEMGINTLNESELHRVLKSLYKENNEGCQLEAEYGPYIVDIKTADGNVIEIQTQSLGHLKEKVAWFTGKKKKITVVYPLIKKKTIETKLLDGSIKTSRSPVHKSIYSSFRELTALASFLLSPRFFLDTVEVTVVEEREETEEKVQSRNGRRRYMQNWLKTGKRIKEIGEVTSYHGRRAWKSLLPEGLGSEFCRGDFYKALKAQGVRLTADEASLMLWVYVQMGLAGRRREGRKYVYTLA